jgi:hypothetical protein
VRETRAERRVSEREHLTRNFAMSKSFGKTWRPNPMIAGFPPGLVGSVLDIGDLWATKFFISQLRNPVALHNLDRIEGLPPCPFG